MANFKSVLSYLSSLSNDQKGTAFELYCKWYLENDLAYKSQLRRIWLWQDWPGKWGRDKGIDLIAETKRGEVWAIQAKAYDAAYSVTKQDIDTFLSESSRPEIAHRLLIATTDKLGQNAREVINAQEKKVSIRLLYHLQNADLDWPESIEKVCPAIPKKPKDPRPHQQEAITNILNGFQSSSIGQVYMACGTGKTLVGLWVAHALQCKNVLVLVPSISLVSQLHKEWVANAGEFKFDPIFICSDPTVAYDKDQMFSNVSELGYPVTTSAQELCKQMKQSDEPNVVFATYHSSGVITEACSLDSSLSFDLAIADEAHRCAGSKSSGFTTIVDKGAVRAERKLFMTATRKYFSDRVKKIAQEKDFEIVSMNDEQKFGRVFYSLPFSAAIKQDLLSDYQVIIAAMDNTTYQEYADRGRFVNIEGHETDARTLASQILVAKTIKKYGLKKVISFHSRKKSAKEFIDSFNEVNQFLPDHEQPKVGFLKTIFGEMPQQDRNIIMKQFKEATQHHAGLIGNVKCLSEGVDVPAIDGIAFVDPKGSEIDIIQTIGRAIRKSKDKTIGTIIIPIFIDSNTDEDELFNKSCFKPVWQVIKASRAQDDTLAEELDNVRLELGSRSYRKPSSLTKIVIDVPEKIDLKFCENIKTKIAERCGIVSLAKSHPELIKQWHLTKNGNLTPNDVTAGNNKKAWWICKKKHEWQAVIANRAKGKSCGICKNRQVNDSNSLSATHPELAKQWHPTKNENLKSNNFVAGSGKKIWWKCEVADDHEWQAAIYDRSDGKKCPVCLHQKVVLSNCLATTHPELAKQWHPTKNGDLSPMDVISGGKKKIWWKCDVGKDHEWQARISDRKKGRNCAVCRGLKVVFSNSLKAIHPVLADQWHSTKNGNLLPEHVTENSHKKVWWQCPVIIEHVWLAVVSSRARGNGCPFCVNQKVSKKNSLSSTHPELVRQWHLTKNGNLTPNDVVAGGGKKAWWQCLKNDVHFWEAQISSRAKGAGCPHCYNERRKKMAYRYSRIEQLFRELNVFEAYSNLNSEMLLLLVPPLRWIRIEDSIKLLESISGKKVGKAQKLQWSENYNKRALELEKTLTSISLGDFKSILNKLNINKSNKSEWDVARIIKDSYAEIKALIKLTSEPLGKVVALNEEGMPDFAIIDDAFNIIELIEVKVCHLPNDPIQIFRYYLFSFNDLFKNGGFRLNLWAEFFEFNICLKQPCRFDKNISNKVYQSFFLDFIKQILKNQELPIQKTFFECKSCQLPQHIFYHAKLPSAIQINQKYTNKIITGLENKMKSAIGKAYEQLYPKKITLDNDFLISDCTRRRLIYYVAADAAPEFFEHGSYNILLSNLHRYAAAQGKLVDLEILAADWLIDWFYIYKR